MTSPGRARCLVLLAAAVAAIALPALPAKAASRVEPVAEGLEFPTNLAFTPDGRILFTEKDTGRIRVIRNGRLLERPFASLDVVGGEERGLLGIAVHPEFDGQPWVYVYFSDASDGRNRLVRLAAEGDVAGKREVLLDLLPSVSGYHNGGDLAFGADGSLFIATGEAHEPARAQDPNDLGGKVLRIEPDGSIPADNPFGPANPVYSLGHRNSFGLCVNAATEDLWETENGPDRDDEINLVLPGRNYGWPDELGRASEPGLEDPVLVFSQIIVPTGCAFWDGAPGRAAGTGSPPGGTLYFGDFGGGLHRVELTPPRLRTAAAEQVVARLPAGIVDVATAPDGDLYVATTDSILRLVARDAAGEAPPAGSPAPEPSAVMTVPASPEAGKAGAPGWLPLALAGVVLAGVVLALGALRLARSRRR